MAIKVGDKVKCSAEYDVNGTHLASFVRQNTYDVIQVNGDRVVIGIGKAVTAAVDISKLTGLNSEPAPVTTPPVETKPQQTNTSESAITSEGLDQALKNLLNAYEPEDILLYNMRLHGIPHQFTEFCDYRTYSSRSNKPSSLLIGRKFIENIMLEAPVVTIVPGKPVYLPAAKNSKSISYSLLSAANGSISELMAVQAVQDENLHEKLRYYDFQQDYVSYMNYVNILCAVAAAFLDLQNYEIDGVQLVKYDWKDYRWNKNNYHLAVSSVAGVSLDVLSELANTIKTYGENKVNELIGKTNTSKDNKIVAFDKKGDQDVIDSLESILTQLNFVQFYVDSSSGVNESNTNTTANSKLEGIFDSGSELIKEVGFIANSGGIDATALQASLDKGADAMNEKLFAKSNGAMGGVLSRLLSSTSNIIKGDNMIFPKIYQDSAYTKSYSISIDLRAPQGNRLSYFLNILVPLFHLLALSIPKQTTANTYGSPFLIKAYYPGVFSCNLGIVESITIDKNSSGGGWTVDGYPNEVKVTLNIIDLYSDLNITPPGDIVLFLANSSLIEYLATNCGVNLVTPQLKNRVAYMTTVIKQAFANIPDTVSSNIWSGVENWIASITGV